MTLGDSSLSRVPVCLVAFQGESAALACALDALPPEREPQDIVLCSADPELESLATAAGLCCVPALPATYRRESYWCLVSAALRGRVERCNVLRAGTTPGVAWYRRFPVQETDAAAIFPLSVRHPVSSVFSSPAHEPSLTPDEIDRWLNAYTSALAFDIPCFAGESACINVRLLQCASVANDVELAAYVREQGSLLLLTDNIYVDDRAFPVFSLPSSLYPAVQTALNRRHPLTGVRHALEELSSRGEAPTAVVPPVQPARLHISHSWGGGLGRWVEDFVSADTGHRNFVLRPIGDLTAFGQTLALYGSASSTLPLRTWTLAVPILSTAIAHHEYRQLLNSILTDFGIESIIVSSLIGHALDVLFADLPLIVVCHDYYPFCPPILATWGSPCWQCDAHRLTDCLQNNPGHRFFRYEPASHWLALRTHFGRALCESNIPLVAPSASVAERMRSLMPVLDTRTLHEIAHGLPQAVLDGLTDSGSGVGSDGRLRIVVLGSLETHKGADLLKAAVAPLANIASFVLVGSGSNGDAFASLSHVEVWAHYEREDLGALLTEARPDIGLLLSIVPETFSYTLSELHAAGIPVAATALGAFTDRIQEGENGWLYSPDPESLLALLHRLASCPREIANVKANLVATVPRTAVEMVADYNRLLPTAAGYLPRPKEGASGYGGARTGNININPEASLRDVFREFWQYVRKKVDNTEKLPRPIVRTVSWLMGVIYK